MEIKDKNKEYNSKYNLVYSCQYHVIFTPKYRRKVLVNGIDNRLKELIKNKEEEYEYQVLEMEMMPDHVHLLIDICPKLGVYQTITKIKGYTSRILRNEFPSLKSRIPTLWTRASFISSVGSVSLQTVKEYIENQKYV